MTHYESCPSWVANIERWFARHSWQPRRTPHASQRVLFVRCSSRSPSQTWSKESITSQNWHCSRINCRFKLAKNFSQLSLRGCCHTPAIGCGKTPLEERHCQIEMTCTNCGSPWAHHFPSCTNFRPFAHAFKI